MMKKLLRKLYRYRKRNTLITSRHIFIKDYILHRKFSNADYIFPKTPDLDCCDRIYWHWKEEGNYPEKLKSYLGKRWMIFHSWQSLLTKRFSFFYHSPEGRKNRKECAPQKKVKDNTDTESPLPITISPEPTELKYNSIGMFTIPALAFFAGFLWIALILT